MLLTPEYVFRNIESISVTFLQKHGITALVLDVDNTLTGDGSQALDNSVQDWLEKMRAANISLTIVSNNWPKRVQPFADRVGLAWVPLACKPLTLGLAVARHRLRVSRRRMAMVGDQIFTDRLAAGLYRIPCLLTLPRGADRQKGVQLKRKYEAPIMQKFYDAGGKVRGGYEGTKK